MNLKEEVKDDTSSYAKKDWLRSTESSSIILQWMNLLVGMIRVYVEDKANGLAR